MVVLASFALWRSRPGSIFLSSGGLSGGPFLRRLPSSFPAIATEVRIPQVTTDCQGLIGGILRDKLGLKKNLRLPPGDGQELERGVARPADALLPTSHGIRAHVEIAGKKRLAGIERSANAANLFGRDLLGG